MKYLLTTVAAVLVVGCGEVKESSPQVEAKVKPTSLYSLDINAANKYMSFY